MVNSSFWLSRRLLDLPRWAKLACAVTLDLTLCVMSVPLAVYLRLGELQPNLTALLALVSGSLIALPLLAMQKAYRTVFRYAGWSAVAAIARALLLHGMAFAAIFTMVGVPGVPRTIGILQPLLMFLLLCLSRGLVRVVLSNDHALSQNIPGHRLLIYGAGSAGRQLCAGLLSSRDHLIVGFIDDDPKLIGRTIFGKAIYGPDSIGRVHDKFDLTDVLLAIPSAGRAHRANIIRVLRQWPFHVRTLPGIAELAAGHISTTDLREVQIDDLLAREAVPPDARLLARDVSDKVVMVTGAGGSIGSELCRQAIRAGAARVLLVDQNEFGLYAIDRELSGLIERQGHRAVEIVPVLASIGDKARMSAILQRWRPDTVYHAAAYKHVPLIEANPLEAIRNNVLNTLALIEQTSAEGTPSLVMISTDKAVRPTNVMGATKRLAEQIVQASAFQEGQRRSIVRFGNVLGSSGSVVPLFREQIDRGGPITVTHPDIIRYFMTIPEAAQLVVQAGAMGARGEVFLLDMGAPVKIVDLARNMIDLSGLTVRELSNPDGDIEIAFTGLRPGEKLYEELLIGENARPTDHPRIMQASETHLDWPTLLLGVRRLERALAEHDEAEVLCILRELVPEFAPQLVTGLSDNLKVRRPLLARG